MHTPMTKTSKNARTLSEWWHVRYAWEHYVVGTLVGFLLGALLGIPLGTLLSAAKLNETVAAATLNPTSPKQPQ